MSNYMKCGWKIFGSVLAVLLLFLARPGTATADMLTACDNLFVAPQGVHQILGIVCPTAGGGTLTGDVHEIDSPTLHAIVLDITISCPVGSGGCADQTTFTGTYQTFIGPGTNSVTLDGTLDTLPGGPLVSPLTETIFESGQGTTFDNNPAVVSGSNTTPFTPVPFFFTQTKEGDFNGQGTHIVGLRWSLPAGEEFVFPVEGELMVPEPPALPFLAACCLGLLSYVIRRQRTMKT